MLPNDPRLKSISSLEEVWMYAHIKRRQKEDRDFLFDCVKMICTFVNPEAAEKAFTRPEITESEGFFDDIKAIDPNFQQREEYEEILDSME